MTRDCFQLFGLEPRLALDLSDLERRFHALSRRLHPDVNQDPNAQEAAAALNDAYRILRDPIARAEYLLGSQGLGGSTDVPAELLEEVFEWNSAAEAGEMDRDRFQSIRAGIDEELGRRFAAYDSSRDGLPEIRRLLDRRKYVNRLCQ